MEPWNNKPVMGGYGTSQVPRQYSNNRDGSSSSNSNTTAGAPWSRQQQSTHLNYTPQYSNNHVTNPQSNVSSGAQHSQFGGGPQVINQNYTTSHRQQHHHHQQQRNVNTNRYNGGDNRSQYQEHTTQYNRGGNFDKSGQPPPPGNSHGGHGSMRGGGFQKKTYQQRNMVPNYGTSPPPYSNNGVSSRYPPNIPQQQQSTHHHHHRHHHNYQGSNDQGYQSRGGGRGGRGGNRGGNRGGHYNGGRERFGHGGGNDLVGECEAELRRNVHLRESPADALIRLSRPLKLYQSEALREVYNRMLCESRLQHAERVQFFDWYIGPEGYGMTPSEIPCDGVLLDPNADKDRTWATATEEDLYHLKMIGSIYYNVKFLENEYEGKNYECVLAYLRTSQSSNT